MAVVVFDNGGGGGDSLWSTATNWVGNALPTSADEAQISANCTLDMDDIIDKLTVDAGITLTMGSGGTPYDLTGMTKSVNDTSGVIYMNAGCELHWNTAAHVTIACTVNSNGTSGNLCVIKNDNAGNYTVRSSHPDTWMRWTDLDGGPYETSTVAGKFHDCQFNMRNSLAMYVTEGVELVRCYAYGATSNQRLWFHNSFNCRVENLAWGYDRAGTAYTVGNPGNRRTLSVNGVIMNSGSWENGDNWQVIIQNDGYIDPTMLPGTSSDLDTDQGVPGVTTIEGRRSTTTRSTSAKRTGTYGTRVTPKSALDADNPAVFNAWLPISSGETLTISVWARRNGLSSDCVEVIIDPEGTWFDPKTLTATLTSDATWYEITGSPDAAASGSGETGSVKLQMRVLEYIASDYVDWADLTWTRE